MLAADPVETGEIMAHQRVTSQGAKVVHLFPGTGWAFFAQGLVPSQILQFMPLLPAWPAGAGAALTAGLQGLREGRLPPCSQELLPQLPALKAQCDRHEEESGSSEAFTAQGQAQVAVRRAAVWQQGVTCGLAGRENAH